MILDNQLLDQSKRIIVTETMTTTMSSSDNNDNCATDLPASKKIKPTSKKGVEKRLRELEKECLELRTEKRKLRADMKKSKAYYSRTPKVDVMSMFDWNIEEANLASIILTLCKHYLFTVITEPKRVVLN
jgi:hypothetical protein